MGLLYASTTQLDYAVEYKKQNTIKLVNYGFLVFKIPYINQEKSKTSW